MGILNVKGQLMGNATLAVRPPNARSDVARGSGLAIGTFAAALWLFSRPYTFAENDGQLYSFLALAWAYPERFGQDLFIRYGSQDAFSVFSPIYGSLIRWTGLEAATFGLMLVGGALWLLGCWRLTSALLGEARGRVAFLLLSAFHIGYGGFSALIVGEGFLTGRLFAEALVLLALADLRKETWWRSGLLLCGALTIHPLMALAGWGVAFLIEGLRRPWMLAVAAGGLLVGVGLALIGLPLFNRVFLVLDEPWLALVRQRNAFVFLTEWTIADWSKLLVQALVVGAGCLRSSGWVRRFSLAVLIVAAGGVVVSWIGADLLHRVLIVQLQLWRSAWPLAWAAIPALLATAPQERRLTHWIPAACFGAALLLHQPWMALISALAGWVIIGFKISVSTRIAQACAVLIAVIVAADAVEQIILQVTAWKVLGAHGMSAIAQTSAQRKFAWLLAPVALWLLRKHEPIALWLGLGALVLALSTWDHRSSWVRYVMAGRAPIHASRDVLWGDQSTSPWFLLRTQAYVSLPQASGLLFSRETALAWRNRVEMTHGIVTAERWAPERPMVTCASVQPNLTQGDLAAICEASDPPSGVILPRPIVGNSGQEFETPAVQETICRVENEVAVLRTRKFHYYSCKPAAR